MSLKKTIATMMFAATVSASCNNSGQKNAVTVPSSADSAQMKRDSEIFARANEISDSLHMPHPIDTVAKPAPVDSAKKTSSIDTVAGTHNPLTSLTPPFSVVAPAPIEESMYTISMDRVRKGPLGKMKLIAHNLGILLGTSNVDSFMWKYNKAIADTLIAHNSRLKKDGFRWLGYEGLSDLKVPMVNPKVKDFFDPLLSDFVADKEQIKKEVDSSQEVIIVTRQPLITHRKNKKGVERADTVKKHVIAYYRDGKLVLADYMSGGEGVDKMDRNYKKKSYKRVHAFTPEGVFETNYKNSVGDKRDSAYVSKAFKAAMPYATPFANGTYLHTGVIDGNPRSHACARQTGRVAMQLYDLISTRHVKVVVSGLYDPGQEAAARKNPPRPYRGHKKHHKKPKTQ